MLKTVVPWRCLEFSKRLKHDPSLLSKYAASRCLSSYRSRGTPQGFPCCAIDQGWRYHWSRFILIEIKFTHQSVIHETESVYFNNLHEFATAGSKQLLLSTGKETGSSSPPSHNSQNSYFWSALPCKFHFILFSELVKGPCWARKTTVYFYNLIIISVSSIHYLEITGSTSVYLSCFPFELMQSVEYQTTGGERAAW